MADSVLISRCMRCGAGLPPWFDPTEAIYDVAKDDALYVRWLDVVRSMRADAAGERGSVRRRYIPARVCSQPQSKVAWRGPSFALASRLSSERKGERVAGRGTSCGQAR